MSISKAILYAKTLEGVKYGFYGKMTPPSNSNDKGPFWIKDGPVPSLSQIKKEGINCTGVINLMRRKLSLPIPTSTDGSGWSGDTGTWFENLRDTHKLKPINRNKTYPYGTLLLLNYNPINQGHVAVVVRSSKKGLLSSKILHAKGWGKNQRVVIEKFSDDIGNSERYTHICLPKNWLK
jgi:hypothetical protein